MNKPLYFKICSFAIGGFLIIWSAVFTVFLLRERGNSQSDVPESVTESVNNTVKSAEVDYYTVKAQNGEVVVYEVFTNGYSRVVSIPDIPLKQLSEQDRKSFEDGFVLEDRASLASLIEDFTS